MCLQKCMCMYMYIKLCTVYIYVYIYMYMCIYIYVYVLVVTYVPWLTCFDSTFACKALPKWALASQPGRPPNNFPGFCLSLLSLKCDTISGSLLPAWPYIQTRCTEQLIGRLVGKSRATKPKLVVECTGDMEIIPAGVMLKVFLDSDQLWPSACGKG